MGEYKTPGVYVKEKNAFGNSVVEAETAIPAFIGYTEKAQNGNDLLTNIPWKISSMTEFVKYFGGAPKLSFDVDIKKYHPEATGDAKEPEGVIPKPKCSLFQVEVDTKEEDEFKIGEDTKKTYTISYAFCVDVKNSYTLYYNMLLFFANGGGACYIVSVGNYNEKPDDVLNKDSLVEALDKLKLEQEITMVVIPEAANLKLEECKDVQQQMLSHCGYMQNRFALLDIYQQKNTTIKEQVKSFQENIGSNFLSYGATYFPWLNSSVLSDRDLDGSMFTWSENVFAYQNRFSEIFEIVYAFTPKSKSDPITLKESEEPPHKENGHTFDFNTVEVGWIESDEGHKLLGYIEKIKESEDKKEKEVTVSWITNPVNIEDKQAFHLALLSGSTLYQQMIKAIKKHLNQLPPSAAIVGIYSMVDKSRGVWKAPANVTLNYVDSPSEDIDDEQQAEWNVPTTGKAVNVIRMFRGEGIKIWGARTLDGNSQDWRYVNVRRTMMFLEESVKNAARAYVFEPNDAGTWINMKCMIESFLRSVWKRGGLAGATPEDAFEVHVGLGDTMTADDILEGILRITVLVAISHPAEFIEITFQQQMQKS